MQVVSADISVTAVIPSQSVIDEAIAGADSYFSSADGREELPAMVRFAFHSCVGATGCNGCLNLDNVDNTGLQGMYDTLNTAYAAMPSTTDLSRADFWAIWAMRVLQYVAPSGLSTDEINNLEFGRVDCSESPHESALHDYPNPRLDWQHVKEAMGAASVFGLTNDEIVALIAGAHSLGDASLQNSGFEHPWDATENTADNIFVCTMNQLGSSYQHEMTDSGNWQFTSDGTLLALNTDAAILKDISVSDTNTGMLNNCQNSAGETTLDACPDNAETAAYGAH